MKKTTKKLSVKIGRGYQITIPKEIIKALKLKVGDLLEATLDKKKRYFILTPVKTKISSHAKEEAQWESLRSKKSRRSMP